MTQHSSAVALNPRSAEPPPAAVPAAATVASPVSARRKRLSLLVVGVVVLALAAVGAWFYISGLNIEETDDAFIAGNTYQVAPRTAGRLSEVLVNDNQTVAAGDLLARIDDGDQQAALAQARAALALAQAQQEQSRVQVDLVDASTNAGVAQAQAELAAADAKLQQEQAELDAQRAESERAQADQERYAKLSQEAVSRQRLDVVRSTAISAASSLRAAEKTVVSGQADLAAAQSKLVAAQADRKRVDAARAEVRRWEAQVQQAQAAMHQAELSLSYTRITAPAAGRVTNKSAEAGDYLKEGRTLLIIVPDDVWVTANFKETQLRAMHPGQAVDIYVDAYRADLKGRVDSIQAGSGAQFSLLPPQNATGNYVKVVQRIPVKIVFDDPAQAQKYLLGPGMSVVPRVHTQ